MVGLQKKSEGMDARAAAAPDDAAGAKAVSVAEPPSRTEKRRPDALETEARGLELG